MRILVTGGSGFVGGALCAKTVALGWETVSLARRPSQHGLSVQADLTRPIADSALPPGAFDAVVHAAARSSPWGARREFEAQNIEATRNLIDWCRHAGCPHLVYISTSAVLYRNEHQLGMDESLAPPPRFINEYARAKFAAEELVRAYPGPRTILRPRAVFGPGDTVVFPRLLRVAKEGKFPLIESAGTEPVQADLIYIDTLVDYIVRVIEKRATGLFHLTNNQPVTMIPFLTDIFARLDLPAPRRRIKVARAMAAARFVEILLRALPFLGEPPITRFGISVFAYSKTMNVTKSLRELGPPSVSLEDGIERFLAWYRAQQAQAQT